MSPYGVGGGHRHTPEIEQGLSNAAGEPVTVSFTPTLAPMSRGILTTATAKGHSRARTPPQTARRLGSTPTTTSRSCTCCRRASGPPPSPCVGSNHAACSWPSMSTPAA